ncbi:MAG: hypothetical protein WB565_10960, partial [Acidimicrobiales bacterium]
PTSASRRHRLLIGHCWHDYLLFEVSCQRGDGQPNSGAFSGRSDSSVAQSRATSEFIEELDRGELLLKEFEQAWLHYRQNESLRTQYLVFVGSVALAIPPVLVALEALKSIRASSIIFADCCFLGVAGLLFLFAYLGIRRFDEVMRFYESVWQIVRERIYLPKLPELLNIFNIRHTENYVIRSRIFRAGAASRLVPLTFLLLDSGALVVLTIRLASEQSPRWQLVVSSIITAFSLVAILGIGVLKIRSRRR